MSVQIAHASLDENGKTSGGNPGDQTGKEVCIRSWHSKPWNVVLRATDSTMREKIAQAMKSAAENNNIGYDQSGRNSLLSCVRQYNYDMSKVTQPCECDCSSLVSVACMYAGIPENVLYKNNNCSVTSNLRSRLMDTGKFQEFTDYKYVNQEDYLLTGDILLKEGKHVAVAISDGDKAKENPVKSERFLVDVSRYNTITSYDQMAQEVDGVIIRAGYRGSQTGQIVEDSRFQTHITELLKRNVKIGLYFYTQAIDESEGVAEAQWLIEQAKKYKIDYPLFIDSEYSKEKKGRADHLDKNTRTKIMTAFCKEVSKSGYVAGVYASDNWFKNQLNFEELKDWFIWCARYSTSSPTIGKYDAWQYGSQFFSWATDKIDVNHWYNNDAKIITPITPDVAPKTFKNIVKVNTHLNIRNKPTVGNIVGRLNNGDNVVVIGYQKGWLKIGNDQWVSETYVHSSYGLVTANSLNVRKGNSTAYESLGFVHKNNNVKIVKELGGWYQIITPNGLFGWASSKYIDLI